MSNYNVDINYSLELDLLLNCIQCQVGSGTSDEVLSLVKQKIDWQYLLKIASSHGVLINLYQALHSICPSSVPKNIVSELRNQAHINAIRNAIAAKELLELLDFLNQNDIRALSFKGLALSQFIYGNIVLRQFSDLDILIQEHDFDKSIILMKSKFNYETVDRGWKFLNPEHEKKYILSEQEFSLSNGNVVIDLHQKLITPDYFLIKDFNFEKLWEKSQIISLSGHQIRTLGTEDLLLYLCIHGSKECWRSLKWICDVAALIQNNPSIDWLYIKKKSEILGSTRMFFIGILLVHKLINISLPKILIDDIKTDQNAQEIVSLFIKKLFIPNDYNASVTNLDKLLLYSRMMRRKNDKINILRFWLKFIKIAWKPNTKDLDFLKLPNNLYFLYFFIHPFRLVYQRLKI